METIITSAKELEREKNNVLTLLFQLYSCQQTGSQLPLEVQEQLNIRFGGATQENETSLISFNLPDDNNLYYLDEKTVEEGLLIIYELDSNLASLRAVGEIDLQSTEIKFYNGKVISL